jgi:hypothetical protein
MSNTQAAAPPHRGLTLSSRGRCPASRSAPLMSNVKAHEEKMLFWVVGAIFVVVPVVCQLRARDIATGASGAALLIGMACGLITFWKESWAHGLLVFFLAAFAGFAIAYGVGLVFRLFGITAPSESEVQPPEPSERRELIGGLGAIAIPPHWWQTGIWESIRRLPLLGFCAFLVLGLATMGTLYIRRRRRSRHAP